MLKTFLSTLEANPTASFSLGFALFFCFGIGCATISSLWTSASRSVCFAHHAPAECDPALRVRSPEETAKLHADYVTCLDRHAPGICDGMWEH